MNSKKIGGEYERQVAVKLSKWLTGSDEKLVCWRSPHSGSVGTNRKKKDLDGENVSGDFQCLDSNYEEFFNLFHCDSKNLGDVHLCLINPNSMKSSQLFSNWRKVILDAGSNKIPLMFVKARNDRKIPEFLVIPAGCQYHDDSNMIAYWVKYNELVYNFMIVLQDDFFRLNNWEDLIKSNKINVM
jgi:hypothetical protein